MGNRPVGIVGGGIVGLAIAREFTRRFPGREVVVFEAENQLGMHQTGHNSGVVHAGIYYPPGSLKAQLCTRGRLLLREFCAEHGVAYEECGKLVVAVEQSELGRLDDLEQRSRLNGVPGLRRIDESGITEVEPHAVGLAALHSPETAITDYVAVAEAMGADIVAASGRVLLNSRVTGIRRRQGGVQVRLAEGTGTGDDAVPDAASGQAQVDRRPTTRVHDLAGLVVCAGLQADRVAGLADGDDSPRIVPFRGEYLQVTAIKQDMVNGMVYPVPDPRYPFLGVHFTRRVGGALEVGPNAVLALQRDGYGRTDISVQDVRSIVTWPGFWQLARQHWRTGIKELRGSLSMAVCMAQASRYVPAIGVEDVVRSRSGVRAQAVDRDGTMVDDFRIVQDDVIVNVRNAPSPAATSSLAIAEFVADRLPSWA